MYRAANKQNDPNMEAASKAQEELKRIEEQIQQLHAAAGNNQEAQKQLMALHERVESLKRQMSGELTAWERTELARHPNRPYPLDYIERIFPDFSEIHGDRAFGDDAAMICGRLAARRQGSAGAGHAEGARHQAARPSQLWPTQSRGLSQSATGDEICREVATPDHLAHRRRGRVSRTGRGRARAGRSDCSQPARDGAARKFHSSRSSPAKAAAEERWRLPLPIAC